MTIYPLSLVQTAIECYNSNWGYIYATSGELWTEAKQANLIKTKANNSNYSLSIQYGSKWIGHYVADCSGLIVYLGRKLGFSVPHGSNSIWKNSLSQKGILSTSAFLPPGALVFKLRNATDYYHVGVYVGDGKVVEAQGSKAGVIESKLSSWTHYGLLKAVDYSEEEVVPLGTGEAVVDVPNDGTVNIRVRPSSTAKIQDTLHEGDTLEVLAVSGDWAKVRYSKEGYIMAKFLKAVVSK